MYKFIVICNVIILLFELLEIVGIVKEILKGVCYFYDYLLISVLIGFDDVVNKNSVFINWELIVYIDIMISLIDEDVDVLV